MEEAENFCRARNLQLMQFETDSLSLLRGIKGQWKISWGLEDQMEEIRGMLQGLQATITHIFREGNYPADIIANQAVESQVALEYNTFMELPANIRRPINMDKMQVPNLRIKTRRICLPQE